MLVQTVERPELNFDTLRASGMGIRPIALYLYELFGRDNYEAFRVVGKEGKDVDPELKQKVDERVYGQIGARYNILWGRGLWHAAMERADETVNYARKVLFPDQDREASLTTNIFWSTNRPSAALERLTKSAKFIGEQCRAEQLRQLALAVPCADEIIVGKADTRAALTEMNHYLEKEFFIGRSGDPKKVRILSYHAPGTNKLLALSSDYPDQQFPPGFWVKSVSYPVRKIGIRDSAGNIVEVVHALYDQREKGFGERVIKGLYKSKKDVRSNGKIEVVRHVEDLLGFRLVIMEGGHPMRDQVMGYLESKLGKLFGVKNITKDDSVDPDNGHQERFSCRRRKIFAEGSTRPLFEAIVQSIEDYIPQEYEIGKFDEKLGMHDGPAHPLYELKKVAKIAPELWPFPVYGIDIADAVKAASFGNAARLAMIQRISPSPYMDLELV